MNAEVKKDWVEALRSGDYVQGKSYLSIDYGPGGVEHCCLGVLCQLAVLKGVIPAPEIIRHDGVFSYEGEHFVLPLAVVEWAGIDTDDPLIDPDNKRSATGVNDEGSTFDEIAGMIEENL